MLYDVYNDTQNTRIIFNATGKEVTIRPGLVARVDLEPSSVPQMARVSNLIFTPIAEAAAPVTAKPVSAQQVQAIPAVVKPPLYVTGHFGIGDNIHQRAVARELMKKNDVWLGTCHYWLYHDLIEQGLKLVMRTTSLHAQAKTISREQHLFRFPPPPPNAHQVRIGYPKQLIDKYGSILETMFGCASLKMPEQPDFSLPIRADWKEALHKKVQFDTGGKPLMLYRPIVVRNEWNGRSRNPDVGSYSRLYQAIRKQFFVISIADLIPAVEWIEGPEEEADLKLHKGELSFPEMAALFEEADLVFCNAGFAPVLAQAVHTPVIIVYGGRESFRTTQRVGTHLAQTCPIDVINPCDCHSAQHKCDKRIDVPAAEAKIKDFVDRLFLRDTLVFGTFYVDSPDRDSLTDLWKRLHLSLNEKDCDFLAVDSQSPIKKFEGWAPYDGKRHRRMYFNFPDNIGHLSRPRVTPGRDGWGRAFCKGLEIACELGYKYVAHIEGDSLFRLKVADVIKQMQSDGIDCASTDVSGMRTPGLDKEWIETGLMFFSTDYLKRSHFISRYDWPHRQVSPTPERFIRLWILEKDLTYGKTLRIMPWKALRADKNQITKDNILALDLDWVTHQHDSSQQDVYRQFVDHALTKEVVPSQVMQTNPQPNVVVTPQPGLFKLNLGCGTNKLAGWVNRDADVDITKRLPWDDNSAGYISIEHCVEHVSYKAAIEFFKEARRVLAPGGVLRVTVPSLEQIAKCEDADYHKFTTRWQNVGPTKRGAMHAIIYAHGHECAWNSQLMQDTLYFAGFDDVREYKPGESEDPQLQGVEGHGRVIGDKFNLIESCTHEARKSGQPTVITAAQQDNSEVAVVIGGAECWSQDLEAAKALIGNRPIRYFYINDQIKTFSENGIACTLHPDKLNGHFSWLPLRRKAGLPEPQEIWSHRKHAAVTHDTASMDWQGSTGLFGVQVARRKGYKKIIACGIPMTVEDKHFERHQPWQSAIAFRQGWVRFRNEIAPVFRSMSGWTADQFGKPDEQWLREG